LRADIRLVEKKGSHSVKKYTEKRTKDGAVAGGLMSLRAFG